MRFMNLTEYLLNNRLDFVLNFVETSSLLQKEKIINCALEIFLGSTSEIKSGEIRLKAWMLIPQSKIHNLEAIFDLSFERKIFTVDYSFKEEVLDKIFHNQQSRRLQKLLEMELITKFDLLIGSARNGDPVLLRQLIRQGIDVNQQTI